MKISQWSHLIFVKLICRWYFRMFPKLWPFFIPLITSTNQTRSLESQPPLWDLSSGHMICMTLTAYPKHCTTENMTKLKMPRMRLAWEIQAYPEGDVRGNIATRDLEARSMNRTEWWKICHSSLCGTGLRKRSNVTVHDIMQYKTSHPFEMVFSAQAPSIGVKRWIVWFSVRSRERNNIIIYTQKQKPCQIRIK